MPVKTAKTRETVKVPTTKMCTCCHQVRMLSEFYSNRDWVEQLGKDVWCKSCAGKAKTKDELRKYFWENNREWSDRLWDNAYNKALQSLSNNKIYQKTTDERRRMLLDQATCQNVLKSMQLKYKFVDNSKDVNVNSYEEAKEAGKIVDITQQTNKKADPNIKVYNTFFNGDFKPAELEFLEAYYADLERDFSLTDISLRDNAKKLAKAALMVDKLQNDFAAGRCSIQDLQNAISLYNTLMNMGNFAASKRKPEDKAGLGSWSEIAFYCETNGHPMTRKIEWPKDDVDKTIDEFRYLVEALDLGRQ